MENRTLAGTKDRVAGGQVSVQTLARVAKRASGRAEREGKVTARQQEQRAREKCKRRSEAVQSEGSRHSVGVQGAVPPLPEGQGFWKSTTCSEGCSPVG